MSDLSHWQVLLIADSLTVKQETGIVHFFGVAHVADLVERRLPCDNVSRLHRVVAAACRNQYKALRQVAIEHIDGHSHREIGKFQIDYTACKDSVFALTFSQVCWAMDNGTKPS